MFYLIREIDLLAIKAPLADALGIFRHYFDSQEKMNILYSFLDEYKVWMIPQQMRQVDCVGVFKKIQ